MNTNLWSNYKSKPHKQASNCTLSKKDGQFNPNHSFTVNRTSERLLKPTKADLNRQYRPYTETPSSSPIDKSSNTNRRSKLYGSNSCSKHSTDDGRVAFMAPDQVGIHGERSNSLLFPVSKRLITPTKADISR